MKTSVKSLAVVTLIIISFALSPKTEAVNPPPDGGYPGFTTAEGTNALKSLTTGVGNTAAGWYSLFTNSTGTYNTALGAGALFANTSNGNTATGAGALLIVQQQETTETLVVRLNDQEARIQKVSTQVEMRKSGSQMLVENQ